MDRVKLKYDVGPLGPSILYLLLQFLVLMEMEGTSLLIYLSLVSSMRCRSIMHELGMRHDGTRWIILQSKVSTFLDISHPWM